MGAIDFWAYFFDDDWGDRILKNPLTTQKKSTFLPKPFYQISIASNPHHDCYVST
jgi:hypothetical protein